MSKAFKGIFGLWTYPLINFLLSITERTQTRTSPIGNIATATRNVEEWEWVDSTGKKRTLTVHRKVE